MRSTRTAVGALIVACFILLGAAAAGAQYDPDEGPLDVSGTATPGGSVTISGACYAANAEIEITVDGAVVKTVRADADGRFSTSVTVPGNASGTIVIRAAGLTADGATCVLSSTVSVSGAGATAARSSGSSGTRLPVTGTEVTPGFVITAIVLVAVGAGMVLIARRRRTTTV